MRKSATPRLFAELWHYTSKRPASMISRRGGDLRLINRKRENQDWPLFRNNRYRSIWWQIAMSPPRSILIDSGAWIALFLQDDPHHAKAKQFFGTQSYPQWITTSPILSETYTWLRYHAADSTLAMRFSEEALAVEEKGKFKVIRPDEDLDHRAAALGRRFADLNLSGTDLLSFATCQRESLREGLGFDEHFFLVGLVFVP